MDTFTILTGYKLHKQFTNSVDLYDLVEAYYPEKHNTIVRMRKFAYTELAENGVIKSDGVGTLPNPLYKTILNTQIPTNWFSCPPSKIIDAVEKLRSQIDLLPPVYLVDEGVESDLFVTGERLSFPWFPYSGTASHHELVGRFIQKLIDDISNDVDILAKARKPERKESNSESHMLVSSYIHNVTEGERFCNRYGIAYSITTGENGEDELIVQNHPSIDYREQYATMKDAVRKIGFGTDHPNCFLTDSGVLIVTFSNYDGELIEDDRKKLRRKGYDIQECEYDLYGFGTKTYLMAELVSPLDVINQSVRISED